MDFTRLLYFKTIAETGNMTQAARILFVTQPNLSTNITKLEDELGVNLFNRRKGKIELTQAGKLFLTHVNTIFDDIVSAKEAMSKIGNSNFYQLCVGCSDFKLLNSLLTLFNQKYEDVFFMEQISTNADIARQVQNGTLHIGISYGPPEISDLDYEEIYTCKRVLVASSSHCKAASAAVCFNDLYGVVFCCNDSRDDGVLMKALGDRKYFKPLISYRCTSTDIEYGLLNSGKCMALLPISAYIDWKQNKDNTLMILPIDEYIPDIQIGVIHRKNELVTEAEANFIEVAKEYFAELDRKNREYIAWLPSESPMYAQQSLTKKAPSELKRELARQSGKG